MGRLPHHFIGGDNDGTTVHGALALDRAGNFYGTASGGGKWGGGIVYRFTHSITGWRLKVLYSFLPRSTHGDIPSSDAILSRGRLYGTTLAGGDVTNSGDYSDSCGTVYELQ
jgi:uncharacterized repeat protein (TIGR03803 family)